MRESINHNSGWQREFLLVSYTQKVSDAKMGSIRGLLFSPAEIFWKKQFERMTQMWRPWQKRLNPIVLIFMAIDNKSHLVHFALLITTLPNKQTNLKMQLTEKKLCHNIKKNQKLISVDTKGKEKNKKKCSRRWPFPTLFFYFFFHARTTVVNLPFPAAQEEEKKVYVKVVVVVASRLG